MSNIAIIGSGSWGSALAIHLANNGNNVKMWSFSEEEKDLIKRKMALMGVTSMSDYLRKMAIDGRIIKVDYSVFDDVARSLESISANINQIAKRINATDTTYAGDVRQIKQKQEEIWQLLRFILSQLP